MPEPVVRLEGVGFTYAGSAEPALREIDLTVYWMCSYIERQRLRRSSRWRSSP